MRWGKFRCGTVLFFICSAIVFNVKAQFLEFGGGVGLLNYAGDLNRGYPRENANPGITLYNRLNLSEIVSVKYAATFGKVTGTDDLAFDALGEIRQVSFSRPVLEGSMVFEYNFLDFKDEYSRIKWSPYLFGGVGFVRLFGNRNGDYSMLQPVVPFGLGFKQLIGKQFAVNLEVGIRKTFFDELDDISDGDIEFKDFQFGNPQDRDWYSFVGLSLSYIIYKIPCPFKYIPNGSIYR